MKILLFRLDFFGADNDPAQIAALVQRPVKRDSNNFAPVFGFAFSPSYKSGNYGPALRPTG